MDSNNLEEQFKKMTDSLPSLIRISGPDNFCTYVNMAWQQFTGRTLSDESGQGWLLSVHPEDLAGLSDILAGAISGKKEFRTEYRLKRYDGIYIWISDNGKPHFKPDGSFGGFVSSCVDLGTLLESGKLQKEFISRHVLNKQELANEELSAMNEELSAANEELTSINEELSKAQDSLTSLNGELEEKVRLRTVALQESEDETQALNEELSATNEELAATNEELLSSNEELIQREAELQKAFDDLSAANRQVQKNEKLFRTIATNIPGSLITVVDCDQKIISLKGDLMEKLGLEKNKDYEGRLFSDIASLEDYSDLSEYCGKSLKGANFSIDRISGNGNSYVVHYVPLRDDKVWRAMFQTKKIAT